MRSPEIDKTRNSQIYIIDCKTIIACTILLCIKGNNSQFQIDKFNGPYFKTDKSQNKNRVW